MNKNDYKILDVLAKSNCISSFRSLTLTNISEKTGYSIPKLRTTIKILKALGYIEEGDCSGQKKTYYITEAGIELMKANMNK